MAKRAIELEAYGRSDIPLSIDPHPYLLFVNHPGYAGQINSLGLRGPEVPAEKRAGQIRVLFLGGSTTYSILVKDYTNAWPWQAGLRLAERTGRDIEVLNAGVPYATTAENLASYVFRYRYLKPDIVVIEAGGNDQVAAWYPDYSPEYVHLRGHGSGWRFGRLEKLLLKSNVAKVLYCRWIVGIFRPYSPHPFDYKILDKARTLEAVRTNRLEGFRRNLDFLAKSAQRDGSKVLLFGFVNAPTANLSKNRTELQGFEEIIALGTRRHREVLTNVAESNRALLAVPRQDRFTDDMFTDDCHLTEAGERVKADECLPALLQLLE